MKAIRLATTSLVVLFLLTTSTAVALATVSPSSSSSSSQSSFDTASSSQSFFPAALKDPPYLALITNRNACDNESNLQHACVILEEVLLTSKIDLVAVRINQSSGDPNLVLRLIHWLTTFQQDHCQSQSTSIVVWSDWLQQAIQGGAHGIHVKETCIHEIPTIRHEYQKAKLPPPIVGMTVHSLKTALEVIPYHPDYLCVGSCYFSGESHPEKTILEGPAFPGQVATAIQHACPVLAIGGVTMENCQEPLQLGATGVTVLRSIFQSSHPAQSVIDLWHQLQTADQRDDLVNNASIQDTPNGNKQKP